METARCRAGSASQITGCVQVKLVIEGIGETF